MKLKLLIILPEITLTGMDLNITLSAVKADFIILATGSVSNFIIGRVIITTTINRVSRNLFVEMDGSISNLGCIVQALPMVTDSMDWEQTYDICSMATLRR
jgi:hypothetical protein